MALNLTANTAEDQTPAAEPTTTLSLDAQVRQNVALSLIRYRMSRAADLVNDANTIANFVLNGTVPENK